MCCVIVCSSLLYCCERQVQELRGIGDLGSRLGSPTADWSARGKIKEMMMMLIMIMMLARHYNYCHMRDQGNGAGIGA